VRFKSDFGSFSSTTRRTQHSQKQNVNKTIYRHLSWSRLEWSRLLPVLMNTFFPRTHSFNFLVQSKNSNEQVNYSKTFKNFLNYQLSSISFWQSVAENRKGVVVDNGKSRKVESILSATAHLARFSFTISAQLESSQVEAQ
jgi:hypothetical protein